MLADSPASASRGLCCCLSIAYRGRMFTPRGECCPHPGVVLVVFA